MGAIDTPDPRSKPQLDAATSSWMAYTVRRFSTVRSVGSGAFPDIGNRWQHGNPAARLEWLYTCRRARLPMLSGKNHSIVGRAHWRCGGGRVNYAPARGLAIPMKRGFRPEGSLLARYGAGVLENG